MQIPAKITFHNIDSSEALETRIKEKIDKLEQKFKDIIGCQVTVEAVHQNQQKGTLYSVNISVTLPKEELVASQHTGKNPLKHDKVFAAMNDAFAAMERQLTKHKEMIRREVKHHDEHWHNGEVSKMFIENDHGFIAKADGSEVYFHRNSVDNDQFDNIEIGQKARFIIAKDEGHKGPQASLVKI